MKKKEMESEEEKRSNESLGSHENLDPDSEIRSVPERNVQTLIRPQVTNPKIFWSKSEDEDFSSDVKYKNARSAFLEEKVNKNVFKPIRSEISPKTLKPSKTGIRKKETIEESSKSIHESLRIQKVKRRTSLPFLRDEPPNEETPQAFEKIKTYDVSYYSSIMKRMTQESSGHYYSTSRKKIVEPGLIRSASDECIYGERQPEVGVGYPKVKGVERLKRSERLSVTEPSSPLSDHSAEVRKPGRSDSDMDSEGSTSDGPLIVEMKKSKSFVDEKNADGYFKSKNYSKKASTLEVRKPSVSSGSSCDSVCRTRSLRKSTKTKRKSSKEPFIMEPNLSKNHSYVCYQVRQEFWPERRPEREVRRRAGFGSVPRERSQSWNREGGNEDSRQKISADVFQHLLSVLMQKNRGEPLQNNGKETFSKSLPRSRSRRSKEKELGYEKDYWKGNSLRGEGGGAVNYSWVRNQRRKEQTHKNISTDSDSTNQQESKLLEAESYRVRRKTDDREGKSMTRLSSISSLGDARNRHKCEKPMMETPSKKMNPRTIIQAPGNGKEERIFSIEDENLWIELCKAVGKVDGKGKKAKKC